MSCSCAVCLKHVKRNQRRLSCTICKKFVHKCCSNVTSKEFRQKVNTRFWHCSVCNDLLSLPFNHIIDDNEYLLVLYNMSFDHNLKSVNNIIVDRFKDLVYNPMKDIEDTRDDSGVNFDCYSNNTEYYTDDNLDEMSKSISDDNLSMLNVNIRSICKNLDSLKDYLHCCNIRFNVIGIAETWLNDKPHDYFQLNGYNLEIHNRDNNRGGGVCLYVDEKINYSVRHDLNKMKHPDKTETLFIEIDRPKAKNVVIGIVYRSPDQDVRTFNQFVEDLLSKLTKNENKLIYIMGDFNINLLNEDVHVPTNEFIDMMTSYSLYPSITKPTRISTRSATLIDNIFTNSHNKQKAGILLTDISDHLPTFVTTNLSAYHESTDKSNDQLIRDMSEKNMSVFKQKLRSVDWDDVCCSSDDVNKSYASFIGKFNSLYDECFPKKKLRKSSMKYTPKSPWITSSLIKCIRRKNLLYKKSINKPTELNIQKYKMYRNKLNVTLRLAKQNYFSNLLDKEKHNMRNTWKILNSILRTSKKPMSNKFVKNNVTLTDSNEIANEFNKYFSSIGPTLASSIKHTGNDYNSYLRHTHFSSTCFLQPTDEEEIAKIIKKLGNKKSPGHDNIKSDLIKTVVNEICYPLRFFLICL